MAASVSDLRQEIRRLRPPPPPVDGGGGGGDDSNMDIDKRLTEIEKVIPTLATKADLNVGMAELRADLHKMDASIKTWMIATIIGLFFGFAGLFFAMSNSLKSAPAPAASPLPPVIINVPAPSAAPPIPAQK